MRRNRSQRRLLWGGAIAIFAAGLGASPALAEPAGKTEPAARILGSVIEGKGKNLVLINRGRSHGVVERSVFDVYRPAQVVRLPMTEQTAYIRERVFAQLVIVSVDKDVATGRVVEVGGGVARVPGVERGSFVASNPYMPEINIPPFVSALTATPRSTELGRRVKIEVRCEDEAHDLVYYEWTATGGLLSHARSSVPRCTWLPPATKGTYEVTVTAVDTAGHRTSRKVKIQNAGFAGIRSNVYKPLPRVFGKHTGLYGSLSDIAFDEANQAYLLEPGETRITGMDGDWTKRLTTLEATRKVTLGRGVARGGFLYLLDLRNTRGLKLPISRKMLQDKPAVEYGEEGVGNGRFEAPIDIATDGAGRVYILDGSESRPAVHVFANDGSFIAALGSVGEKKGRWKRPVAIGLAQDDTLYVLDDGRKRVLVFQDLLFTREFQVGTDTDELKDVKVDRFSGRICVLDGRSGQVRSFGRDGQKLGKPFGKAGDETAFGRWADPARLRFDNNGSLYLLSEDGKVIHQLDPAAGEETARWGGFDLSGTKRLAAAPNGDLALLVPGQYRVASLDARGWIQALIGGRGDGNGRFQSPTDVQVDADGNICVADNDLDTVQVFTPKGKLLRVIGRKGDGRRDFENPIRLAMDPARKVLAVLEERDAWNVKLFDQAGRLKAAFPGVEDYLEDALDLCIARSGRVHVAVDNRKHVRVFNAGKALKGAPVIDGEGRNRLKSGDYQIQGVDAPERLRVTNLGFLFVLKRGKYVLIKNLANNQDVAQIKTSDKLGDPRDVAVDSFDRAFIWDADNEQVMGFMR